MTSKSRLFNIMPELELVVVLEAELEPWLELELLVELSIEPANVLQTKFSIANPIGIAHTRP